MYSILLLLTALLLMGQQCCGSACDLDGDDWTEEQGDCDDQDATVYPGAPELCDGRDNNCDGNQDEGLAGMSEDCPASTCNEILASNPGIPSGVYWIDPSLSNAPLQVHCDMVSDGGGWSLLITLLRSTWTFPYASDWPSTVSVASGEPDSTGMYHGSLAAFSEVKEEISSGKVVVYGRAKTEAELNEIRESYGYLSRLAASPYFYDLPSCRFSYSAPTDDIPGCSRYAPQGTANTDTVIGWAVDINETYYSHCWFARGNCCSSAGGSALCNGDPNGTKWARTWFR